MTSARILALVIVVLAGSAHAGERARIENVRTEWQNAYGAIIYTVLADVKNVSDAPLQYVKVRVELRDKNGNVVAQRGGYNAGAEILEVVVEGADAATPEQRLQQVKPIPPGGTDLIRLSLDKSDIGKPFRTTSLHLVEVR
jgi:hypothetical protein